MKFLAGLVIGIVGGWVVRSIAESTHGVGVELMSAGLKAKDSIESWAAAEYERVADMAAEARARLDQAPAAGVKSSKSHEAVH